MDYIVYEPDDEGYEALDALDKLDFFITTMAKR